MKVIFLDIDGVLNTFCDGVDEVGHKFNESFVNNLIELVDKTSAKIVVISSWRYRLKKVLEHRNYNLEIFDIVPDFSLYEETQYMTNKRGNEIDEWLEGKDVEKYIILDDRNDFLYHQQPKFIKTSDNFFHDDAVDGYGFTKQCLEKAIRILK